PPTTGDGVTRAEFKKQHVTLCSTVLTRKSAVQSVSRFALNMPNRTMSPETIPIKRKTTCTAVNGDVDIPKIAARLLSSDLGPYAFARPAATVLRPPRGLSLTNGRGYALRGGQVMPR